MPELPEVETWRRALHRWLVGRRITRVLLEDAAVIRPRLSTRPSDGWSEAAVWGQTLVGATVRDSARVGKRLGLRFDEQWVLVHLGMTGRFVRGDQPSHARLGLETSEGIVWFSDVRRFGCVVPLDGLEGLSAGLGPDALQPLTAEALAGRFPGRRALKVALLDQARLAGLGNIHAVEALWRAGIAPAARCDQVSDTEWEQLSVAVEQQLRESVEQIPEVEDFVYVTEGGDNPFEVYGREGQPCRRCTARVERFVQGGRSTFWCPGCQPMPKVG